MTKPPEAVLPITFFTMPRYANTTMTTAQLREVLLRHNGRIIAKGVLWDIRGKRLGAGVNRVYLEESE